ncbi:pyrroloquinoline-quinone synthase PqqC [Kitasatospora aureofaciens]|uniref:pyrroloquinoline-quinone synthase PqqC n=1 Tax=Kitasatospora aureofaciens TaxID=1894 RepID=UPI0004C211AE
MTSPARTPAQFTADLHAYAEKYWHHHPFHLRLHEGELTADQLRLWIANRWYYQARLPQKDAAVIANCPVAEVRRRWTERIVYQDGAADGQGGHEEWLRLAEAAGLERTAVLDGSLLLPGVRFATDAYVDFARTRPWTESVAASLTELFSPDLMRRRLDAIKTHYTWIAPSGHGYFTDRPPVAAADAEHALGLVIAHCATRAEQDAALAALSFKCDVLWSMLDAIEHASEGATESGPENAA